MDKIGSEIPDGRSDVAHLLPSPQRPLLGNEEIDSHRLERFEHVVVADEHDDRVFETGPIVHDDVAKRDLCTSTPRESVDDMEHLHRGRARRTSLTSLTFGRIGQHYSLRESRSSRTARKVSGRVNVSGWAPAAIGHPLVERLGLAVAGRRLRVLAYHDVSDAHAFRQQMEHLATRYRVISGERVITAITSEQRLPPQAVWITFDDGHPSVFELAQPILRQLGIPATAYVCPGAVETGQAYWWEIVREASSRNLAPQDPEVPQEAEHLEGYLKCVADAHRREVVADLARQLQRLAGTPIEPRQASLTDLRSWVDDGFEVGNHTWDHPCLDRCTPGEQRRQVREAHEWLDSNLQANIRSFAYPNGNWARETEEELRRLGYRAALGFDHHLCSRRANPLRLSRLRVDADRPVARLRAILSGLHPALLSLRATLQARGSNDPRRLPR